jgi:hypothetical protein
MRNRHPCCQTKSAPAQPPVLDGAEVAVGEEMNSVRENMSPQSPRSTRNPHVASETALAAHATQVSNKPITSYTMIRPTMLHASMP